MTDWHSDEGFWQIFYPALFPEEQFEIAEEQIDKIVKLLGFKGKSILDLACGPGRNSVVLAQKGYRVTGVDLSPFLLGKAKERAAALGVHVEWIHADMRFSFKRPGAFDLCLSMFSSFGYFESKQDDLAVLRNIHASLTAGGLCLIDGVGKEWLAKHFTPASTRELEGGTLMIQCRDMIARQPTELPGVKERWKFIEPTIAKAPTSF